MLDFWYSERCTREIKLIVSILTCAIIYYCSTIEKLSPVWTVSCLVLGFAIHVLKIQAERISPQNPYAQGFKILFSVLPIAVLIFIMCLLPNQNKIFTAIQTFGFTALGFLSCQSIKIVLNALNKKGVSYRFSDMCLITEIQSLPP